YTPVGPVILAAKTGAALVPLYIHLNENYRHHVKIFPEYTLTETGSKQNNVVQNTQGLTTILENFIREVPTQWVWMHERWKTRPEEIDTYK
ncbi:MAG TPA: lipid A biosynthesis lauroyl acyltransferase, partial [Bacteroidetes bacterium]|nr:lipid A biosynthesis lauroyl acyltransferase [Bacteroidota bacterium]